MELSSPGARRRWLHGVQAPHRIAFPLAMAVLVVASCWWLLVQLDRLGLGPGLAPVLSPTLLHATVMTFGFLPLFFAGFLFTAAPRWLRVAPPPAQALVAPLIAQAAGWVLWLAGGWLHPAAALGGAVLALAGLVAVTHRFWRLVRASRAPDRLHARIIGWALVAGCACLAGLAVAIDYGAGEVARSFVLTGFWSFVVVVFLAAANRMIPFFSGDALPWLPARLHGAVLVAMTGAALFEAAAAWLEVPLADAPAWLVLRGLAELAVGVVLLWLARAWGAVRSLRIRLLAMFHLGFAWFGLALALGGAAHLVAGFTGTPVLPLAALHAMAMGCLGSLMLAMVTRVTCGQAGRPGVADNVLWTLFWGLQAAVLLRIGAAAGAVASSVLLAGAAALWAAVMLGWAARWHVLNGPVAASGS
ncbi:MAG: NnrS family protein [Ramlibacter sp.]